MKLPSPAKHAGLTLLLSLLLACSNPETPSSDTPVSSTEQPASQSATLPPGIQLIETVTAEAGKTVIPYQKYLLENGLTLILHEDHSDPLVHVDITYHVGSAREELGKSGFAHFFEHMMFQGSEHVADEEHFKIITEVGGSMNGSTNNDRTNYYQTVPSNQLEKMLWLESDRMGFLVDAVTQEKFEVQRETVKNERGQRIDNRPYGRLGERVSAALYPEGHPYAWPVIGFMEDLNRVDVEDLKKFFLRWYGPNNATLTIGGDIDVKQALIYVDKYFATIPRGPEVTQPIKPIFNLEEDRYISMQDNIHLPLLNMTFPTVSARHPDEAPLDVLSEVLGGGKSSLLYKNLVKNQIAVQAGVSHPCRELACNFDLYALVSPNSGHSLTEVETIIRATIDEFEQRGVQPDDLIKVKANMEAAFIYGLQSVHGKVSQLAANQTYTGNPNFIEQDIARYINVTSEDVMRVFNQYIKGKFSVIMSVVPNGKLSAIAHKDSFTIAERNYSVSSSEKPSELVTRRPKDNFDRNLQPPSTGSRQAKLPDLWRHEMKNGISLLGTLSTETPTTTILIKIPGGHYQQGTDKAGTSNLLAAMLNESTLLKSTEEMSHELDKLGAQVSIGVNDEYVTVYISSLSKHIDAALALAQEKMFKPAFLASDFARLKEQTLQGIENSKKNAGYLASRAYQQLRYGDTIAALPSRGTAATVAGIKLQDIKAFYATHFKPENAQVITVSELNQATLTKAVEKTLKDWQGKGPALSLDVPVPKHAKGTIYLVNKEDAVQTEIRIGNRAIKADITGEFYRLGLMNFPLGGHFNSRINLNLREDKGYTYGASTGFSGDKYSGSYTASASVKADKTTESITEFVKEISDYHTTGISDEELAFLKKAINQRDALKYETPSAKLGFLAQILEHDLSPEFVKQRNEIVRGITAKEINQLASQYLKLDEMFMVIVGDAKTLKPQLEAMNYTVKPYTL